MDEFVQENHIFYFLSEFVSNIIKVCYSKISQKYETSNSYILVDLKISNTYFINIIIVGSVQIYRNRRMAPSFL